jgi:hypothetical protein
MRAHCCDQMRTHVEAVTEPPALATSDRPVVYDAVFDEYCLPHGPALATPLITFCPWCGATLPESKRDRWFAELQRCGHGPDDPDLDDRFRTDTWWSGA